MAELCNSDFINSTGDNSIDHQKGNVVLFSSKISIWVSTEFIGHLPEFESESGAKSNFFEGSILTLASVDAF